MTAILVTGGAGYIGSHTAKALNRAGFDPVVVDDLSAGHRSAVRWGPLFEGDFADRELLRAALSQHEIAAVFHFAAEKYVDESIVDPAKYFDTNVRKTLVLLDEVRAAGVACFVFSSTAAVYGICDPRPLTETDPTDPESPYADSKLMIERVLESFGRAYGLKWFSPRYFNAAGADADGEIGCVQSPATHLIPIVIEAALGRRPHFDIFGTDYETRDGTAIRDFIHVDDLAAAHVAGLQHLRAGGAGGVMNLGTGTGHSVREVIAAVERVGGRSFPLRESARRAGDIPVAVASAERAHEMLDWRPKITELDQIVATTWQWEQSRAA